MSQVTCLYCRKEHRYLNNKETDHESTVMPSEGETNINRSLQVSKLFNNINHRFIFKLIIHVSEKRLHAHSRTINKEFIKVIYEIHKTFVIIYVF